MSALHNVLPTSVLAPKTMAVRPFFGVLAALPSVAPVRARADEATAGWGLCRRLLGLTAANFDSYRDLCSDALRTRCFVPPRAAPWFFSTARHLLAASKTLARSNRSPTRLTYLFVPISTTASAGNRRSLSILPSWTEKLMPRVLVALSFTLSSSSRQLPNACNMGALQSTAADEQELRSMIKTFAETGEWLAATAARRLLHPAVGQPILHPVCHVPGGRHLHHREEPPQDPQARRRPSPVPANPGNSPTRPIEQRPVIHGEQRPEEERRRLEARLSAPVHGDRQRHVDVGVVTPSGSELGSVGAPRARISFFLNHQGKGK